MLCAIRLYVSAGTKGYGEKNQNKSNEKDKELIAKYEARKKGYW